jgi:catechol 2,3-dioxygenase-like lactoylglutathione lyase family enzyme
LGAEAHFDEMLIQKCTILFSSLTLLAYSSVWANSNFSRQTIDLGVVVTDAKKSLAFYKDVIGFEEVPGFEVKGKFPKAVGLTDGSSLNVHVLVLGEDESATKLKVMQVDSKKPARTIEQPYIHTVAGFSYLTIFVEDVDLVITNANKYGHEAYAKSPQILPKGFPQDLCLLMLKDPDGNFVEIVGPNTKALKKKKSKK